MLWVSFTCLKFALIVWQQAQIPCQQTSTPRVSIKLYNDNNNERQWARFSPPCFAWRPLLQLNPAYFLHISLSHLYCFSPSSPLQTPQFWEETTHWQRLPYWQVMLNECSMQPIGNYLATILTGLENSRCRSSYLTEENDFLIGCTSFCIVYYFYYSLRRISFWSGSSSSSFSSSACFIV